MYYPELLDIVNKTGAKELIDKLDKYLAFFPNKSSKVITASNIASRFEIDYNMAHVLLEYLYEMELVDKVYIAVCPQCGRELLVARQEKLIERVKELDYCHKCKEDITISPEEVYVGYKVIKEPDLDEEDIITETQALLGVSNSEFGNSDMDMLQKLFNENKENPNDFFYKPSEADYNSLIKAFERLDLKYENTTDQGSVLEGIACSLFNLCSGMKASPIIKTPTNQIDCVVRNDYFIPLTIYKELGSVIKAECKNEPDKTPGNGYYHKLHGIIQMSKIQEEQAVGILFSRNKAARTCTDLERQYFLRDRIIIVNIYDEDLKRIIYDKQNFLDLLQEKIQTVKNNISVEPDKHNLYR